MSDFPASTPHTWRIRMHHAQHSFAPSEPTLMVVPWHDPVVDAVGLRRAQPVRRTVLAERARTHRHVGASPAGHRARSLPARLRSSTSTRPRTSWVCRTRRPPRTRSCARCSAASCSACRRPSPTGSPCAGDCRPWRSPPVPDAGRRCSDAHASGRCASPRSPDLERGRALAAAMVAAGDDPEVVERQLLAVGVPPATQAVEAASAVLTS